MCNSTDSVSQNHISKEVEWGFLAKKGKHRFSLKIRSVPSACSGAEAGTPEILSCHADVLMQLKWWMHYNNCRSNSYSVLGTIKAEKQGDASAQLLWESTLWQTYFVKSPLNIVNLTMPTLQWLKIECLFDLVICHIVMAFSSKKAIKLRLSSLNKPHT